MLRNTMVELGTVLNDTKVEFVVEYKIAPVGGGRAEEFVKQKSDTKVEFTVGGRLTSPIHLDALYIHMLRQVKTEKRK